MTRPTQQQIDGLKAGDRVECTWALDAGWEPGVVVSEVAGLVTVRWSDGSEGQWEITDLVPVP